MSIRTVAELMAISARTAPKAAGRDFVAVEIVQADQLAQLGEAMIAFGQRTGKSDFDRDGENVLNSGAVLLIGLKDADVLGLDCAACGSPVCIEPRTVEGEFLGPNCAVRILDMGIAIGSAVKTAGLLNVDNRVMYRAGVVARELGLIDADFAMGIPLSATGKSPYFDR
ncbi:MAG: DUF2148 domain-containing protein [Anaerolineae bacterium]|jgi:uncharacterized ferredoxin-like protein